MTVINNNQLLPTRNSLGPYQPQNAETEAKVTRVRPTLLQFCNNLGISLIGISAILSLVNLITKTASICVIVICIYLIGFLNHQDLIKEMELQSNLLSMMSKLWSIKVDESREVLKVVGSSKNPNSVNIKHTDLICRTVMRCPNEESRQVLCKLHEKMKDLLRLQGIDELDWLRKCLMNKDRSGFTDGLSIQKFLQRDPESISTSRLITGLVTLLTAITYLGLDDQEGEKDTPERVELKQICVKCTKMTMPSIRESYPDKAMGKSTESEQCSFKDEFYGPRKRALSICSDDDSPPNIVSRPCQLPQLIFQRYVFTNRSWVSAADLGNIPIRANVSGTCACALGVAEYLLRKNSQNFSHKEIEILAGVMSIPTYTRGDYHTIAETAAGVYYYLQRRSGKNKYEAILPPKKAFRYGLSLMRNTAQKQYQPHIETLSQEILKHCTEVDCALFPNLKLSHCQAFAECAKREEYKRNEAKRVARLMEERERKKVNGESDPFI